METIQKAREIALSDLRSCYQGEGILASHVNYSDYWARDTFWACFGMIEANVDLEQVKKSLELFMRYQRQDGKIPRKVCLDYSGLKYLGIKIKRRKPAPKYKSAVPLYYSVDENLLFSIAFCKYIAKTSDYEFAQKYFDNIRKALEFYVDNDLAIGNLIVEAGLGNWMDSIFKRGFVLYTNCLWCEALREFEELSKKINREANAAIPGSGRVGSQIQKIFWSEEKEYFADNVSLKGKKRMYFDLAGNVLALLFDIASGEQVQKILQKIEEIKFFKKNAILHPVNYPPYPLWKVNPVNTILGISDYHNGISWSWVEAVLIAAQIKWGKIDGAKNNLEILSKIIVENNHLHETYFLDGQPYRHLLWHSAVPFAWGAGLFLYASEKVEQNK